MSSLIKPFLLEIGETTESYSWYKSYRDGPLIVYKFKTENSKFEVHFNGFGSSLSVDYGPSGKSLSFGAESVENPFKLISTVIEITAHVWKNRKELFENGENLKKVSLSTPNRKNKGGESLRVRLYKRFIKNRFPQVKIKINKNRMKIFPEKINENN